MFASLFFNIVNCDVYCCFLGQEWQYAMRREMQVRQCAVDMASGKMQICGCADIRTGKMHRNAADIICRCYG